MFSENNRLPYKMQMFVAHINTTGEAHITRSRREEEPPLGELVFDSSSYFKYGPDRVLLYLDSSQWMDARQLALRYNPSNHEIEEEEKRSMQEEPLSVHPRVIMHCVRGEYVCLRSRLLSEGQLCRALLGVVKAEHMYGFLEAWLCVASQLLPHRVLEPLFALLPRFNQHLEELSNAHHMKSRSTGNRVRRALEESVDALYTRLSVCVVQAREGLGPGSYSLTDEDFQGKRLVDLRSGHHIFPDDYVSGGGLGCVCEPAQIACCAGILSREGLVSGVRPDGYRQLHSLGYF
jgi:hypothetical protein